MSRKMVLMTVFAMVSAISAGEKNAEDTAAKKNAPRLVSVAVLDYQAALPGNKDLGMQMAEILTARLSIADSIRLVERAELGKIIDEQKLKLVGIVNQDDAAKVGKLVGAQLMVMGKAFMLDKKLMIVTKVVGVETGLVKGSIRTVEKDKEISDTVMLLAEDIAALIKKNALALLPENDKLSDPITELKEAFKKKFAGKSAPSLAVIIPEEHIERRQPVAIVDPAVETEVKKVLLEVGFQVSDIGKNGLADWAKKMFKEKKTPWPDALDKSDFIVVGEAFSEFALRTGDLVTCSGRAEVNVIDRKNGKIVVSDSETRRAVDLTQSIAGKTALQNCGRKLGIKICQKLLGLDSQTSAKKDE